MKVVYIEKQTKQKKLFILFFVRLSLTNKFLTPPLLNPLEKKSWSRYCTVCRYFFAFLWLLCLCLLEKYSRVYFLLLIAEWAVDTTSCARNRVILLQVLFCGLCLVFGSLVLYVKPAVNIIALFSFWALRALSQANGNTIAFFNCNNITVAGSILFLLFSSFFL